MKVWGSRVFECSKLILSENIFEMIISQEMKIIEIIHSFNEALFARGAADFVKMLMWFK